MNVLTPDGRQVVVPDADVSSMISQYGGAILDGGTLPQFEMNDGTIVEASANDAPQLIKSGARLLATQSMRLNDPNGVMRTVPLENISKAAMAGFTLAQQPRAPQVQAESDAEQPGVIGEKTWKTAFQEVGQNITSFLPFLNITDMFKDREIYKITKRQAAGEPLTSYEQNTLEAWQADKARDTSWGYKVASTALRMPAFMGEFILSGGAIEGVAKLGLKRAVGKGVITTIDDMAAPATKAILDHAETAFGASREAMETYAKTRLGRAAGMKVALNDIIDAGLVQGKNATKYVTKDAVGAVARNGYEINKAIGNIYATAKIPGATSTTELAQWFLRDNSTELGEAAKAWSSAFWAGAETEASKAAGKKAVEASGRMLARAAAEATIPRAIMQAHRIADTTYQNRIQNVIMKEDDDFLPAFLKAYGDNVIENFSEQTGENMVFLKGMFGKDSKIMLKAAILSDAIPKIAKKKFNGVSELAVKYLLGDNGFLQRTGWNGLIGEMAEEAVGGVLRMGTGIIEPGLPSLSDVSAMAVGFALNPLAGISLVQGARNQNYKDTLAALTKAAEKARAGGKVATSEEEIAPVVESLSKAVESLKPGTVVDAEGKQINPATKGIMNFFDGFGKWLTMSKAANKDIVAYADSVSEGRVTAALKSHEKISKDQLKRIALGLIQRRTIAETPEDLRDLNMLDTEAPITFGDQSIKADYEVAYLGKIGDKLSPERVVELTQKYPEFFHAGIVSVDDAGIELAATGKVIEDAPEYLALSNPTAPSTSDLTRVANHLGINGPLTVERESAAKIIQDMITLTSLGYKIHTMTDALIAHPVDEVSGIGYTILKNASQYTGQELMDTGKVNGMKLDAAKKYVLLHRPGASSGTGDIYATMTQKYQHSSLIEESVESHLKDMFSMNPRIREEAVIGLRQQLDRVNFMLKDDKIPERQRAALKIIAETLSAQAAAKDDRPLIEAFSQFSVGVMGFAQPNLVQKEGGSGAPYYEKTAFTGTRAQQLWREAGLTDEVPAGYAAIYQLPESIALLDRLAARDRAPSKRKIFGEESDAYQSVLKNSGKRYGVEVSMVDGAPVFTPDAAALAKIPSSEAAARHIAGVAKQLYPKKDTAKAQSDYVAKFNAAKAAEFAKEVAGVIIPTAETATAKSVAQYEKELEALQDAPGFNEEEFAKLPSVESIKALVKAEDVPPAAVEELKTFVEWEQEVFGHPAMKQYSGTEWYASTTPISLKSYLKIVRERHLTPEDARSPGLEAANIKVFGPPPVSKRKKETPLPTPKATNVEDAKDSLTSSGFEVLPYKEGLAIDLSVINKAAGSLLGLPEEKPAAEALKALADSVPGKVKAHIAKTVEKTVPVDLLGDSLDGVLSYYATSSLVAESVDAQGNVKLGFAGELSAKAEKLFANKTWSLEKALQESKFTKSAIAVLKKYWPTESVTLRDGIAKVLSAVVPELSVTQNVSSVLPDEFVLGGGAVVYKKLPNGTWQTYDSEGSPWPTTTSEAEARTRYTEEYGGLNDADVYERLSVNRRQGTYGEYFIKLPFAVPGQHGEFNDPNLAGWFRTRAMPDGSLDVQEVQSELFQKNKAGFESSTVRDSRSAALADLLDIPTSGMFTPEQADFLNLMVNDQVWVPVFVNAITKWAKEQGFKTVRFPTGETAAKVEGHQVLAERLAALQEERKKAESYHNPPPNADAEYLADRLFDEFGREYDDEYEPRKPSEIDAEIQNLKTQGIEKLAPIEAFYQNRVGSIVRKMGAQPFTDANGNTWQEIRLGNQATSSLEIAPVAMMRDEAIVKGNAPGVVNAVMSRINRLLSPADQPEEYDERDGVQYSVTDWAPVDLSRSGILAMLSTALMLRNEKGLQGSAAQIARKANRAEAILRRTFRRTMVDLSAAQIKELSAAAGVSVNTLKEAKIPALYNQATLKAWAKLAPSWELNRTKLDAADEADLVFKAGHIELTAENRQKRTDEMLKDRMAVARKLGQYAAMVPVDQLQKTVQALMYEYPEAAIAIKDGNSYIQNRSVDGNAIRERITNHFLNVRLVSKPDSRAPESNASTTGRSLMLRYELAWTSADLKSDEAKEFIMYSRLPKALVDERYAQFDMDVKNGPLLTQLLSSNVAEQRAAGQAALQSLIEDLVRLPKAAIKEQMRRIQFGNGVAKGSPVDKLLKSLDFLASFKRLDAGSNETREATRVVEVTEDGTQIKEQVVVVNTKGLSGMVNANNMPIITQLKQKLARDVADFTVNAIRQAPAHETQLEHRYKSTSGASRQGVRNGDYASEVLTQYLKELGPEYSLASIVSSDTDDVSKLTTDEVFKLMQDMWQNEGNIFVPILSGDHRFVRGILYRAPSRDVDYEKVFNTLFHEMHRRMFDKEYPAGQERATLYDNMAAALKRSSQMVSSGLPAILVEDGAAATVYFVEVDTEENGSDYADGAMHGLPGQLAKLSRSFGHSIRDMSHAIKFVVAGQNEDIKQHTTSISKGRRDENPFYEMLASKLEELSSQLPPNTVVLAGSPGAFKTRNPNMLRIKRDGTYVLPSGQVIEPDQALKHLHAVPLGQLRFLSNQDHTGNVQAIRELIDQALAQPGLTPEQKASIEDMRDTADDAFALRNALEGMFKGVTFSYKAPVYLHSAPALTQQVQNIDGLVDPDHKNAAVTRDAIEANVAMVRPRSLAQFLSDNVADLLPDNEQANAIRTLIKSVKQTFGEDRTQELINVVKAYTDEAPDEVREVMSRIDVIAQDPAFYKALSNVADSPQEYERLLAGMYRDPFDLPGQLQRMNAVIQKATRFMRPSVLTVAVPAHRYGDDLLFDTAMEHLWNGEAGWVTDHQFHPMGTQYAIASGDYGPSGQVRYARVVKRVDIIGSMDETVSAFIKADPVLFGDLINADGGVRLHEIMTRNTTNDTVDMFIPGSVVDTNRVPGTAGSHFLVRLGYRPRGTTGELAMHPELMHRSGADFDVDKWHTYPYLATKIESNDTRIFNQRFVKNLLELYDSPQGQEFLKQAIDLKGFKEALLTTKEIEDAGNKYKNMKPAEFFTLENWLEATKDTRDPRDVLSAAVASLGGTKSLADNGNLYIDFSVMVRDNTSIMQYLPGYSVQKPSLRSNYYAAEVLHNQNNQILDNTKDPLIAKLGLTKSNVSLITALMFAQQHNSKAEALQRLKLLLDFFNNTPEGQFYIETVTQRSSKVPSVLEIRREKEVNPARMADIISGKKTKETRTWWKAVPAVGQIIEFSDFKGNAQQVKVTKINSNLRQLLYQNKNNWNAIAAGEGWSGSEMYNRYTSQSNEYVVPESVQIEFERIGEPYHLEGSAVTKFLKELAKDMFVQNDAMVRLRNDAVNFGDIVSLQEWFTGEMTADRPSPLFEANESLFHVMKREVYDKVPSLLSRTALQLAGWRPDNMVVGRIAGTMAYHGMMQNPPGIRALGETFNKGVVLQARLAGMIYKMEVPPTFARHLLFTGVGGNNVGFQSKYQGEEVLPETIAAAHQEFYEMTPDQQKIVAQYTLATWLPAYTPGSLLELIPPAALAGYTTEWINKTANLWRGSSGAFFNPKFIGYKDTGRIGNSEIPTMLNVDGSVSAGKIENLSRGPEVTKPEWVTIPLSVNKKSGEINTLSFLNGHDDEKLHTALSSSMIAAAKNGIPSIKVAVAKLVAESRGVLYLGNGAPKYLGDVAATYKVPVLELPPSMDSAEQLNAFLNAVQENAGEAPMNIVLVNADGEQLDPVTMQDRKTAYAKLWAATKELPSSRWRVDGFSRVIGQGSAEAMLEASMPIAKAVAFVGQTTVWTPALNEKGYAMFERTDKLIADAKPTEHAPYLSRGLIDATKPQVTMPDRFTSTSKDGQPVSVYRDPTVGWMAQLDQVAMPITDEQALAYYRRGTPQQSASVAPQQVAPTVWDKISGPILVKTHVWPFISPRRHPYLYKYLRSAYNDSDDLREYEPKNLSEFVSSIQTSIEESITENPEHYGIQGKSYSKEQDSGIERAIKSMIREIETLVTPQQSATVVEQPITPREKLTKLLDVIKQLSGIVNKKEESFLNLQLAGPLEFVISEAEYEVVKANKELVTEALASITPAQMEELEDAPLVDFIHLAVTRNLFPGAVEVMRQEARGQLSLDLPTSSLDVSGAQALSRERYTQTYQASKELAERFKGVVGRLDQMLKAERYDEALALLDKTNFGGFLDFKKRLQGVVSRARPAPVKRSSPLWYEEDEQREIGYRFGDATGSYIPVMRDYVDPLSNIPRWNSSPSLNYDGQRALFELTGRQKVKTMAFVQSYMAQLAELDTRLGSKTDRLYQYDPKDGRRQTVNAMKRLWDSVVHKKETAFLENGQVEWTAEDQNFMSEVRTSLGLMLDQIQDGADQKKWDDIASKGVVIQERDIRGQAIVSLRDKGIMSPSAQEILQEANGIVADMSAKSNFDFKIEEKPSGITLKVIATPAKVFEAYAASATKKKLVDAGRAPEELEPQKLASEFRSLFDSAPADIEELGKEMPYSKKMAFRSHYYPHVYHAIGVMSKAEEKEFEAKLKMIRDSGAVLKLDEKQYLEIPKSVFDQSMDLWPDATEFQKQLIARLQRETHAPIGFDGNIVEANKELMRLYYRFFAMRSYDQLKESDKARFNFIAAQDKEFLSNKPQYRIDSGRFKHAVYATFGEAYEKAGLLPKNLDPIEVLRQYVREVFNTAANKNAVMLAATSNSPIDGSPLVVFMPAEGGEAQASIFMPDQYYEAMARSLARSMQKEYNEKLSGIENLKTMATGMAANKDYVSIPVPMYPFFSALYARKGDGWMGHGANAVAAMKNLFGKPASRPWPNFMQNLFANIGRVMGADPDRQALATRDMLKDFMVLTQLMKFNNLAFSPFFGFSAIESFVASEGIKETVRGTRDFKNSIAYYKEVRKQLLNGEFDPRHKRLIANGYTGDAKYGKFDIEMGHPQNMSKWFKEHGGKLGKVAAFLVDRQIAFTEFQFGDLFPVFKYVSSMHMLDEIQNIKDKMGLGDLTDEDYHQVAIAMNDGFGGQNWRDFWWATPGTMQAMNLLLFAPNWGISSFRIAGGSILMDKMGIGPEVTQTQIDFMKKTWISMVSLVLMAWPNFLQSMIYGLFGDPDKDKPFTFLNEKGKRMHVDITPLMRKLPWYKGDPSGERREYVRWGKQAYEVYDTKNSWMADVFNLRFDTLQRKLSAPVRLAIELATGKTAGSDWSMDYKDMGLLGIISGEKEGFAGSRMASILSSVLPYSISGLSTSSEGLPFSWFGSVSKGTSQFDLEQELTRVLRTYADDATYAELEKNGAAQHRLRGLATNVIEAALANGYDPKAVITSARGAVLKNLYLDILKALDENDESAMKKIAPRILRVNGTLDGVIQSLKTRNRRYMTPVELTPEQTTLLEGVFQP